MSDAIHNRDAVKALDELGTDQESSHGEADKILLKFLRDTGNEEVAEAWSRADERSGGFWYA